MRTTYGLQIANSNNAYTKVILGPSVHLHPSCWVNEVECALLLQEDLHSSAFPHRGMGDDRFDCRMEHRLLLGQPMYANKHK